MTRQGAKTEKHCKDEKQIKSIETWHFFIQYMLQKYQQTKRSIINKNLKKFWSIDTLRRDCIIWFADIIRQTLKSKQPKQI